MHPMIRGAPWLIRLLRTAFGCVFGCPLRPFSKKASGADCYWARRNADVAQPAETAAVSAGAATGVPHCFH